MKHLDLFSGIGGFAYAVDQVWPEAEHIFCDNDKFCQQVLKKHWPNSKIYGDIRQLTADTYWARSGTSESNPDQNREEIGKERNEPFAEFSGQVDIITGGFPCQPFSQAGKRRGTEDDRYLWPEMLRVIREFHPRWVIGENVGGFVTWSGGLVLQQVCADLEEAGYEVQPFIIPACAVNAPHRRDRVWIVAHTKSVGSERRPKEICEKDGRQDGELHTESDGSDSDAQITISERSGGRMENNRQVLGSEIPEAENAGSSWEDNWLEVATEFCGVDDGLPVELDGFKLSKAGHRVQRLKSLGNAIVPQVAIQILKAIKQTDGNL